MPEFKPNVPIVQDDPLVRVDVDKDKPLPPGRYHFELVVIDDAGNESEPATIDVIVRDTQRPTAVLDMVDANKAVIKPQVSVGQSFILSGLRSTDVEPGKIKAYRFTLVSQG
ncbi:hypothetical protein [Novosphingobium beihaiensis]|uniref:Ig-like domain-containing protein n=1 Tax=Novosphingobium beihaiensis TaxID=2930389 RepID=A0ABT0BN79_9SPHN|nr:hypothetical protein [Novosphingobium beihaiensis]MCJ2186499.1 hypothetical protein [Novosphingobium beihaiensis]